MGRLKLPAAVPDKQSAFANDLLLSKYLAVRMIPGVVAKPIPIPVKRDDKRVKASILQKNRDKGCMYNIGGTNWIFY